MDIKDTAGDVGETISRLAQQLWDLITVDRNQDQRDSVIEDLEQRLADAANDDGDITTDELEGLFDRLIDRLPQAQSVDVDTLRAALATARPSPAPAPAPKIIRQVIEKPVIQRVTEQRVVRVTEQVHTNVTNVTNNTNNTTKVVHEGSTTVDNRVTTTISADGDVVFDQRVSNDNVVTGKGGVAVNGSVTDSAVNTGTNTGVIAGDDANVEDSVIGDGNTQVNDSEVGAVAGRGDATNVSGETVNTGSGDLVTVEAKGDVQAVTGNSNKLAGDADVSFDRADGPVNVAVGEGNSQQANEDNSSSVDASTAVQQDVQARVTNTETIEDNSQTSVDVAQSGGGNQADVSVGDDFSPVSEALVATEPAAVPDTDDDPGSGLFNATEESGLQDQQPSGLPLVDDDDLAD